MRKYIIFLVTGLFLIYLTGNVLPAPTNTMSITPSAVNGSVDDASDENSRNNEVSTKFNAHDHNDIDQTANTLNVGDATYGNKSIVANNSMTSQPYFRFEGTNVWKASNDGTTSFPLWGGGAHSARIFLNSAQTITTGVNTKVTFDSESWDTDNNYTPNLARFGGTGLETGRYLVVVQTQWGTGSADKLFQTRIFKNGVQAAAQNEQSGGDTNTSNQNMSYIADMANSTDYIEIYADHNIGTDNTIASGENTSFVEVYRLF